MSDLGFWGRKREVKPTHSTNWFLPGLAQRELKGRGTNGMKLRRCAAGKCTFPMPKTLAWRGDSGLSSCHSGAVLFPGLGVSECAAVSPAGW